MKLVQKYSVPFENIQTQVYASPLSLTCDKTALTLVYLNMSDAYAFNAALLTHADTLPYIQ